MSPYKSSLGGPETQHGSPIAKPSHPLWLLATFVVSYMLNIAVAKANIFWMPDFLALTLVYWTIKYPRHISMSVAFFCGLLMDVHNGSVLGQQPLAYVTLSYLAFLLHRRIPWFNLVGQAFHILPLLLISQVVVLLIRLWFDGLWPGAEYFLQSFSGALLWPLLCLILSWPELRTDDNVL